MSANNNQPTDPVKIYVCTNYRSGVHSSCAARGSKLLLQQLAELGAERYPEVIIEDVVCLGECEKGPNIRIAGRDIINRVTSDDLGAILASACGD